MISFSYHFKYLNFRGKLDKSGKDPKNNDNDDYNVCSEASQERPDMSDKMATEQFCLRWNDFHSNITSAFSDIRDDDEFLDVTLVSNFTLSPGNPV